MAPTIFIKFCWFIEHSNPKNMALSAFPRKILLTRKIFFNFLSPPNVAHKPTEQSCSNSIFRVLLQLYPTRPIHFGPTLNIKGTLMLRVVHIRNKKRSNKHGILQTWSINCFYCYVIKSAGEIAKKVLLSIIWNLLFIEINLSQIWLSDTKREKVCAVCPYLLLMLWWSLISEDILGLSFPDICLRVEEKPQPGILARPGNESGPLGER